MLSVHFLREVFDMSVTVQTQALQAARKAWAMERVFLGNREHDNRDRFFIFLAGNPLYSLLTP